MMKSRSFLLTSLLVIASLVLAACGGGGRVRATATTGAGTNVLATATTGMDRDMATETPMATTPPTVDIRMDATGSPTTDATGNPETDATGTPTGTPASGGAALEPPAECSIVELTYWNPFTGPDGPLMAEMVDAFNKANPNIQVTMNSQADYYTQLTTAASSDTLPDIAIVHADQVATQAFRNILRPIDNLVAQVGVSAADFPEAVWQAGEVAGKRYSIPLDIHPMTMYYNTDLFEGQNIAEAPMTREEFEAAAEAMTADDNYGFMITTGFPVQQIFQTLLHQYGGTEFSADGSEATWNSEAGVQALTWMKEAQDKYSEPNLEVDAEMNAFKAGHVGMVWNDIWQITRVTGEAVEFNGVATSVPQIGPEMAVWAGSHQFALPAHSAGPDTCKDAASAIFIRYMLDNSITWSKAGQIPASNAVRAGAEFMALEPQASIGTSVESAFFPPAVPGITDAFGPLSEAVAAVMSGEATDIQAALDSAAERANEILAENKTNFGDAPSGGTQ